MDDESESSGREPPPKMSMTPSWVMLGFVLGALFVVALPPLTDEAPSPPAARRPVERPPSPTPPQLTTIEAVFSAWGGDAVWDDNTTEVAMWNTDEKRFSDFYEVRRQGDTYFFRTIPKLTRRMIEHGKPPPMECPLKFTETEARYREWVEHGRTERRPEAPPQSEVR